MPFGDEKDMTRGGVTFRQVCAEFGLHPADCRLGMAHVPRAVAKAFRDRWEAVLYEGSGIAPDADVQPQRVQAPGRVMTPEGRAKRYGTLNPEAVVAVLPVEPRLCLSLNQINVRLKRAPTRDYEQLKSVLEDLMAAGLVEGTTGHKARNRRFENPRVRYFRCAA